MERRHDIAWLGLLVAVQLADLWTAWTRRTGRRGLHWLALNGLRIGVVAVAAAALWNAIVFTSV